MTSTLKATLLLAIISLTASFAQAQNASLTHIFPQVVDGVWSDGTVWMDIPVPDSEQQRISCNVPGIAVRPRFPASFRPYQRPGPGEFL